MKKTLITSILVSVSVAAFGFSFGNLAKSVSDVASGVSSATTANSALVAKQDCALAKYKESKVQFLKGYAYVCSATGSTAMADKAKAAVESVEKQTANSASIEEAGKLADDLINKTTTNSALNISSTATAAAKKEYADGLGCFGDALKGQIEVGKQLQEIARDARAAMQNGTTAERIQLASSFSPSIELAKTFADDFSKSKEVVMQVVEAAKKSGIKIPSSLSSLLGK